MNERQNGLLLFLICIDIVLVIVSEIGYVFKVIQSTLMQIKFIASTISISICEHLHKKKNIQLDLPKIQIHKTAPCDSKPFFSNHCALINLYNAVPALLRIDKNTIPILPAIDVF